MSLLSDAMENCVMMHKTTADDPYGGESIVQWVDGASFKAAVAFNSSMEARIAQAQKVTSLYTVTTARSKVLEYHEVFRRLRDGKIFRVTSDGDDVYTPRAAGLDMRQVTAEEFLPVGYSTVNSTGNSTGNSSGVA
jgi:hypothetical protein